jgi:transcription antitermination factor NusG
MVMQAIETSSGLAQTNPMSMGIGGPEATDLSWYVTYTCPRHEKYVAHQLTERRIGSFLPLYTSVRCWKDRRKRLELPLFPGYVFVQMRERDRLEILRLPGVVQFVCFQGRPARVPIAEIEALRQGMSGSVVVQPHPFLKVGRRVRIVNGPLTGVEGIFVRRKDQVRIVISISLIHRSVALEIGEADVQPVS